MKIERHTVQWRLMLCFRWRQQPNRDVALSSSPFGKIFDERNAAGNHPDGIRYEIIDGVACPPDGGLERSIRFRGAMAAHDIRCRETWEAVQLLPQAQRIIVSETYLVPPREDPRSARSVAKRLELHHKTVQEQLDSAHRAVARRIYGPFEIADDRAPEQQQAA